MSSDCCGVSGYWSGVSVFGRSVILRLALRRPVDRVQQQVEVVERAQVAVAGEVGVAEDDDARLAVPRGRG